MILSHRCESAVKGEELHPIDIVVGIKIKTRRATTMVQRTAVCKH
jgi:hypothetical protein